MSDELVEIYRALHRLADVVEFASSPTIEVKDMSNIRSNSLWQIEKFKQRMTHEEWKQLLLDGDDTLIYQGTKVQLLARDLGYGVVEVSKEVI